MKTEDEVQYEQAQHRWRLAADGEAQAKLSADQFKLALKELESEILVNGGYGTGFSAVAIDGKNEAIRSARLLQALKMHPLYDGALASLEDAQRDLAGHSVDREDAENEMRRIRVGMELRASENLKAAYADRPLVKAL